jgi:GR25 family glycosyltransferase involved in LPS biosynthesis
MMNFNTFDRFNAIKLANGRVGCSMSHLRCLQLAKDRNYDHLLICEDDTTFLTGNSGLDSIMKYSERQNPPSKNNFEYKRMHNMLVILL